MNNTKTANLAVAAIFIAVTLVVGGTFASTSAFAYVKKGPQDNKRGARDNNGSGNGNGNTITVEKCKNRGSASGFDTATNQECENLICTHPGENATCTQEGAVATPTPTRVSGQGEGQNFCPNAGQSLPAIITFSAQQSGSAAVQGQFTVTVDLGFGAAPIIKTGTLNDLQISGNTFTLTGTELSQGPSRCGDTTPRKCYHHRTVWDRCNNTIYNC